MTDHPKPFRDLSDAEKGALVVAMDTVNFYIEENAQ